MLKLASDERLVELVRSGSEPAFEALYDRHHRSVLAFARHMLGSAAEAEDAVQHTFLAAYRSLLDSDRPIQLRAWLFTIARNRCLSILRVRRERPLEDVPEPSTEHLSSEVQRRQDLRDMLGDLAALPDDQRAALVLAEVGAVSHDEIAEILGCQREKVKALVFQARTSLTASRTARETDCMEIREQLATLTGGALRRNTLKRHLKECEGCRAYRAELHVQRRALAVLLPVAPTLGLKHSILASAFGGTSAAAGGAAAVGGAATAAAGGAAPTVTAGGASVLAAKALVAVAIAGSGAAAGVEASRHGSAAKHAGTPAAVERASSTGAAHAAPGTPPTGAASVTAPPGLIGPAAEEKATSDQRKAVAARRKAARDRAAKARRRRSHGSANGTPAARAERRASRRQRQTAQRQQQAKRQAQARTPGGSGSGNAHGRTKTKTKTDTPTTSTGSGGTGTRSTGNGVTNRVAPPKARSPKAVLPAPTPVATAAPIVTPDATVLPGNSHGKPKGDAAG
jgi:RNA polymerase sigma factor (sigma-70 family)